MTFFLLIFFLKSVIICGFTKPCQLDLVVRFTFISIVKFKKKNEVLYIIILPGKLFRALKYMTNNRFLIKGYKINIYWFRHLKNLKIYLLHLLIFVIVHAWRWKDNLRQLVLSFYHLDPMDQFDSKLLCLWSRSVRARPFRSWESPWFNTLVIDRARNIKLLVSWVQCMLFANNLLSSSLKEKLVVRFSVWHEFKISSVLKLQYFFKETNWYTSDFTVSGGWWCKVVPGDEMQKGKWFWLGQ